MKIDLSNAELEARLNYFDSRQRAEALAELVSRDSREPVAEVRKINMHCHTFFSYNAMNFSPSALAWLARKEDIGLMGIVDFDVLDGVEEFLQACRVALVRGSAAMETRVFIPEFADKEINSPGEPGIYYYMGIGFTQSDAPTEVHAVQEKLRALSAERNRAMVERVNAYLSPLSINYQKDVLPLAPADNATERHMLRAYAYAAEQKFGDAAPFWAEKLGVSETKTRELMADAPAFHNFLRTKLMKRGGAGYVQPDAGSFPTIEEVNSLITACGALPCATWLDGLSAGEENFRKLLELLISKGAAALNIIPDRNWNISDPELRRIKVKKLHEVVGLARELDLPLNIGTEMNAPGQKVVDELDVPELIPVREAFLDGAWFIYGHTMMEMADHRGYQSEWAQKWLPSRRERNAFYTRIGKQTPPGRPGLVRLREVGGNPTPADYLNKE